MQRSLRMLSVAALVAAPMVFGVMSPAGARTATPRLRAVALVRPATAPTTYIEGSGATLRFKPKQLAVGWSGSSPTTCDATNLAVIIINKTSATQTLTYKRAAVATVGPGAMSGICVWGSGTFTFKFGLKGSTHKLTLNVS